MIYKYCPFCGEKLPTDIERIENIEKNIRPWESPYPDTTSYPPENITWDVYSGDIC